MYLKDKPCLLCTMKRKAEKLILALRLCKYLKSHLRCVPFMLAIYQEKEFMINKNLKDNLQYYLMMDDIDKFAIYSITCNKTYIFRFTTL